MPEEHTEPSKKYLWIGIGVLVVIGAIVIAANVMNRGTALQNAYTQDIGTVTYDDQQGSVIVGGDNLSLPKNWPSDAPGTYAGAAIIYSGATNPATGEAGAAIAYTTTEAFDNVRRFYEAGLQAQGWVIQSNGDMAGMRVIVAKKDTRTFAVYLAEGADGSIAVTAGVEF
jgi:hypothetical protein